MTITGHQNGDDGTPHPQPQTGHEQRQRRDIGQQQATRGRQRQGPLQQTADHAGRDGDQIEVQHSICNMAFGRRLLPGA